MNNEKDGINIILFNKNEYYLEFYLTSNKNSIFELELYNYYCPKKLKIEIIKLSENTYKYNEISKQINNKTFKYLSDFVKNLDKLFNI